MKSYSLADPANPRLLDEITSEDLELPGDPPTDFTVSKPGGDPKSTFSQNEDMDDVLRLRPGARLALSSQREVRAKPMSARQQRFLARLASTYRADPATRGLCLLIQ